MPQTSEPHCGGLGFGPEHQENMGDLVGPSDFQNTSIFGSILRGQCHWLSRGTDISPCWGSRAGDAEAGPEPGLQLVHLAHSSLLAAGGGGIQRASRSAHPTARSALQVQPASRSSGWARNASPHMPFLTDLVSPGPGEVPGAAISCCRGRKP